MEQGEVMMQSPWLERPAADGTLVEPADVDEMVGMFQSLLHGLDAGEARRHLAEHGWDLQAAIKGAPLIAAALVPFDGAPLWREAPPRAAEPEREGFDKQMRRIAAARAEVDAARATLRRAPRPSVPGRPRVSALTAARRPSTRRPEPERTPIEEAEECLRKLEERLITVDVLGIANAQDLADECGFTERQHDAVLLSNVAWRAKYGKEHAGVPGESLVQRLPIGEAEECLRQLEEHITTVDVLGIDEDLQAAIKASAEAVPSEWSCAACTLLNPEPLVECAACGGRERAARPPTADASALGRRVTERSVFPGKPDLSVKLLDDVVGRGGDGGADGSDQIFSLSQPLQYATMRGPPYIGALDLRGGGGRVQLVRGGRGMQSSAMRSSSTTWSRPYSSTTSMERSTRARRVYKAMTLRACRMTALPGQLSQPWLEWKVQNLSFISNLPPPILRGSCSQLRLRGMTFNL